jgi:hypothetical protein
MLRAFSLCFLGLALLLCAAAARADLPQLTVPPLVATDMVRGYFDALRRQDRGALSAVTAGQAARDTGAMLDHIRGEAKRRRVDVELQLKDLAVSPSAQGTVEAKFDISVIAKKWLFSTVAQKLRGRATFYVGSNLARGDTSAAKIVGIKLFLD